MANSVNGREKGKRKENESAEKDGGEEAQSDGWKLIKQIGEQSGKMPKKGGGGE